MSMQGKALVASPYLTERNFNRSVVFILRHDEEGAFGLILNRPTTITVGDLMEQFLGHPVKHEAPIFSGGPVEGHFWFFMIARKITRTRVLVSYLATAKSSVCTSLPIKRRLWISGKSRIASIVVLTATLAGVQGSLRQR